MPTAQSYPVLRYIRKLAGTGPSGDPADGQLLQRFINGRDESAFTILLDRHGPMVSMMRSKPHFWSWFARPAQFVGQSFWLTGFMA
jgi:hypothetical protein